MPAEVQAKPRDPAETQMDITISNLEKEIRSLNHELKKKDAIITKLMDVASGQHKRIATLNSALMDTVVWDPISCPSPSCSTPCPQVQKATHSTHTFKDPSLNGSNRYAVLAVDSPPAAAPDLNLDSSTDFPALQSHSIHRSDNGSLPTSTVQRGKASARRKILKDAVLRRSSGSSAPAPAPPPPLPLPASSPPPSPVVPRSPAATQPVAPWAPVVQRPQQPASPPVCPRSQGADTTPPLPVVPRPQTAATPPVAPRAPVLQRPQRAAAAPACPRTQGADTAPLQPASTADGSVGSPRQPGAAASASSPLLSTSPLSHPGQDSRPRPLFPPTTLIVGDSIIRHVRFFNAITHCFPGATVRRIVQELPDLLQSMPSSVFRIIVHVGTNDMPHARSELTKLDFKELFNVLRPWTFKGMSVFISGPLPTLYRRDERFSRTRYTNTWLNSICRFHLIHFIDNFNLFWNRPTHYRSDGIHLNRLGSRLLTNNIVYTINNSTPAHD